MCRFFEASQVGTLQEALPPCGGQGSLPDLEEGETGCWSFLPGWQEGFFRLGPRPEKGSKTLLLQVQGEGAGEKPAEVSVVPPASSSVSPHVPPLGQVVSKSTINNNFINNPSNFVGGENLPLF